MPKIVRYNPVRITNPFSDCYMTHLHPQQSINLQLSPPHKVIPKFPEGCNWDVNINSHFLELKQFSRNGEASYYFVNQKYNLSEWAEHGSVLLGNIILNSSNGEPIDDGISFGNICVQPQLCVLLDAISKNDNVVVINPVYNVVRLDPHQLMEVVLYDDFNGDLNKDEWQYEITSDKPILECLRKEQIYQDSNPLSLDIDGKVSLRSYSVMDIPCEHIGIRERISEYVYLNKDQPRKENHFWFAFNQSVLQNINHSGIVGVCRIDFKPVNRIVMRNYSLYVLLNMRDKHKKQQYKHRLDNFKVVKQILRSSNILAHRQYDKSSSVLVNPDIHETVYFNKSGLLYVKVASPHVFSSAATKEDRWKLYVTQGTHKKDIISVEEHEELLVRDVVIQRFEAKVNFDSQIESESYSQYLGSMRLYSGNPSIKDRTIRVYSESNVNTVKLPVVYNKTKSNKYNYTPQVSDVKIEEITTAGLDGVVKNTNQVKTTKIDHSVNYKKDGEETKKSEEKTKKGSRIYFYDGNLVFVNPNDNDEVVLSPGQKLVVTLPRIKANKLWCCNSYSQYFFIQDNDIIYPPNLDWYQKITVSLNYSKLPRIVGNIPMGKLQFHCENKTLSISLWLKTTNLDEFTRSSPKPSSVIPSEIYNILVQCRKRQVILCDWSGDSFGMRTKDDLKIMLPSLENWNVWDVTVEQSISDEFWNKLPEALRQEIKKEQPWFEVVGSTKVVKYLRIRPVAHIETLINTLKDLNCYPPKMANITFNHNDTHEEQTEIGFHRISQSIIRKLNLHLFNDLREDAQEINADCVIYYPKHNSEIITTAPRSSIVLIIKLEKPKEHWWKLVHKPEWMNLYSIGDKNRPSFKAVITNPQSTKEGFLTFSCKDQEKCVKLLCLKN